MPLNLLRIPQPTFDQPILTQFFVHHQSQCGHHRPCHGGPHWISKRHGTASIVSLVPSVGSQTKTSPAHYFL